VLSVDEFATKIKAKYPEYESIDNTDLTIKIVSKYPEYQGHVNIDPSYSPQQQPQLSEQESFKKAREDIGYLIPFGRPTKSKTPMRTALKMGAKDIKKDIMLSKDVFMGTEHYSKNRREYEARIESLLPKEGFIKESIKSVARILPGMGAGTALSVVSGPGGGASFWYLQGVGSTYGMLKDEGVDEKLAKPIAILAGAPYAAIEYSQVSKIVPGLDKIMKETIKGTAKQITKVLVKKYGIDWATNVSEEMLQQVVQSSAVEIAIALDQNLEGRGLPASALKIIKDALIAGKESAITMAIAGAPASIAVGGASGYKGLKESALRELSTGEWGLSSEQISSMQKQTGMKFSKEQLDAISKLPTSEELAKQEQEEERAKPVSAFVDKKVMFEGKSGILKVDNEGELILDTGTAEYELGTKDLGAKIGELGVSPVSEVSFRDYGDTIIVDGKKYSYESTSTTKEGGISVTVVNEKGQQRTFRGDKALDIEIERNKQETQQQYESKDQTDELKIEIVKEIDANIQNEVNSEIEESETPTEKPLIDEELSKVDGIIDAIYDKDIENTINKAESGKPLTNKEAEYAIELLDVGLSELSNTNIESDIVKNKATQLENQLNKIKETIYEQSSIKPKKQIKVRNVAKKKTVKRVAKTKQKTKKEVKKVKEEPIKTTIELRKTGESLKKDLPIAIKELKKHTEPVYIPENVRDNQAFKYAMEQRPDLFTTDKNNQDFMEKYGEENDPHVVMDKISDALSVLEIAKDYKSKIKETLSEKAKIKQELDYIPKEDRVRISKEIEAEQQEGFSSKVKNFLGKNTIKINNDTRGHNAIEDRPKLFNENGLPIDEVVNEFNGINGTNLSIDQFLENISESKPLLSFKQKREELITRYEVEKEQQKADILDSMEELNKYDPGLEKISNSSDQSINEIIKQYNLGSTIKEVRDVIREYKEGNGQANDVSINKEKAKSEGPEPEELELKPKTNKVEKEIVEKKAKKVAREKAEKKVEEKYEKDQTLEENPKLFDDTQEGKTRDLFGQVSEAVGATEKEVDDIDKFDTPELYEEKKPGYIGIATDTTGANPTKQANKFINNIKKYWRSRGLMPKKAYDLYREKESWVRSQMQEVNFAIHDLKKLIRKENLSKRSKKVLDQALKGEISLNKIPESLRPIITKMRSHIDNLSKLLIDSGVTSGELIGTIEQNLGFYAKRAYRVFIDPKWAEKVPSDIRNNAKAFIRAEYKSLGKPLSEEKLEGKIEELLYYDKTPISILSKGSKAGSKVLDILKKRKVIPQEIRALWGEYKDADVNYINSVMNLAELIANHKFLEEVKIAGLGKFLFKDPIVKDGVSYQVQIASEGSQTFSPLNGLYTSPEIKDAFESVNPQGNTIALFSYYMKAVGLVKVGKTVFSQAAHIRNFLSNIIIAIQQGYVNPSKFKQSIRATATDLFNLSDKAWREYVIKLIKLGVIGEGVRAGELKDIVKDATDTDINKFISKQTEGIIKGSFKAVTSLYQAGDSFWKIFSYENELARYKKAFPDKPISELEKKASEIVSNTSPTYSKIPLAIKNLRIFPIVGSFVSFSSEIYRIQYQTLKLISEEMKDPKTRGIASRRITGTFLAYGIISGISLASRYLLGITNDEEEDLRKFVPEWSKNSSLAWYGKDKLTYQYVDMSFMDPLAGIKKPIRAFLGNEKWEDKLLESSVEALSPFLGIDILTGVLVQLKSNKKESGGRIYNPQDNFTKKQADVMKFALSRLQPGETASLYRVYKGMNPDPYSLYGKKYDTNTELLAMFTGTRISNTNIPKSLGWKTYKFNRDLLDAKKTGEKEDIKTKEKTVTKVYEKFYQTIKSAERLGMTKKEILIVLNDNRISKKRATKIYNGDFKKEIDLFVRKKSTINRENLLTGAKNKDISKERRKQILRAYKDRYGVDYALRKTYSGLKRKGLL